jgi:DNA-binding NarL/FixJ family response regulator
MDVAGGPGGATVRVFLVDDHPSVLDGVGRAIGAAPGLEVVGRARSAGEAAVAIERTTPDVVVCDIQMGGEAEGLRLIERFGKRGKPRFLMLSAFDYPTLFRAAYERGAAGYVLKTAELDAVVDAIRRVAAGGTAFPGSAMRAMRGAPRRPSMREIELLRLVAAGQSNDEIAEALVLSLKTVESHLRRLFNRYAVMNRTELAVLALREGWVDPGLPAPD